jgi:cyclopropane fatty-acyl-phospholipid synthase-like methyltransferase
VVKGAGERLVWAVETLALEPTDHVLEVGCGQGVAVSLACEELAGGSITAIDRSEAMIAMARKRNRGHVTTGKARYQAVALAEADFGEEQFDKIFAFNVREIWMQPTGELGVVKRLLKPGGSVYLFHQPPSWTESRNPDKFVESVKDALLRNGFTIENVLSRDLQPVPAVCVVARAR